jgi:hypothetical protein
MIRIRALAVLLGAGALAACEKNAVQEISSPVSGAFVRFHNYSVGAPGVNFYANDQKLTAVSSTSCTPLPADATKCTTTGVESTNGITYGNTALGGNYAMVTPGQYSLTGRIAAATDNGLAVSTIDTPLADGKFYSYFTSGIYNATTKKADAFLIEDALPTSFDYTKAYIRFVNASANAPTISASTKLQGTTEVVAIATSLAYKSASPIVTVTPGVHDITVTIGSVSTTFTNQTVTGGHVFTLALRGDATAAAGATNALTISGSSNR